MYGNVTFSIAVLSIKKRYKKQPLIFFCQFDESSWFKHLYFWLNYNTYKIVTQWNNETLIGCVSNNQTKARLYFYKFLYQITSAIFPVEYRWASNLTYFPPVIIIFVPVSEEWKENFRAFQEIFKKLCTVLRPYIQENKTRFWDSISVEKQMAATWFYLAYEERLRKMPNYFGIRKSNVSKIFRTALLLL